jgi:hypothetical protein
MRYPQLNPAIFEEGDPLAILDAILDSGVYPGDEMIDDLQVICEMYVEHYWREVEEFQPPGDLQSWAADRMGFRGRFDDIPEVIEAWQNLTAEDAIEFYREKVREHLERARGVTAKGTGTWWKDLTYALGILVLGDDRVADIVVDLSSNVLDYWMPHNQANPPSWECIKHTAIRQGVLERVTACVGRREIGWTQMDDFAPAYIAWQGPTGIFNEAGYQLKSFWYRDEFPMSELDVTPLERANPMEQANRQSFEKYLSDIPYFDCQWCAQVREVILSPAGVYPGVQTDRRDFHLQLIRPSGFPTLLAYVYDWFWNIATMDDRGEDWDLESRAYDQELYEEIEQDVVSMLDAAGIAPDEMDEPPAEEGLPGGLEPGSYAEGTMRVQDRLPVAIDILGQVFPAGYEQLTMAPFGAIPAHAQEDEDAEWWDVTGPYLLDEVIDTINEVLADTGYYLGGHPGHPADFGIWATAPGWQHEH